MPVEYGSLEKVSKEDVTLDEHVEKSIEELGLEDDIYVLDSEASQPLTILTHTENKAFLNKQNDIPSEKVINEAPNTVLKTGNVYRGRRVIEDSKHSILHAQDITAFHILYNSPESKVFCNDIKASNGFYSPYVVYNSNNASLKAESVEVEGGFLISSPHAHVQADDIVVRGDVLDKSNSAHIGAESIKTDGNLLTFSDNASIQAEEIHSTLDTLFETNNSSIKADDITTKGALLRQTTQSYVITDHLDIKGKAGKDSNGSLLAAKHIDGEGPFYPGLDVITKDDVDFALTYTGDWNELRTTLSERFEDGIPEGLKPFNLGEGMAETPEDVEERFDEVEKLYAKVEEEYERYSQVKEPLDLNLYGPNHKKLSYLEDIEDTIKEKIRDQSELDIIKDNIEKLVNTPHLGYLLQKAPLIDTQMAINDFISEFHDGSNEYTRLPGFEQEYHINPEDGKTLTQDVEEANKKLYENGVELLEQIKEGNTGHFDVPKEVYEQKQQRWKSLRDQIREASNQKVREDLIEERRALQNKIREKKNAYQQDTLQRTNLDNPRDLNLDELKEGLNQLHQEHLKPNNKVYDRAKKIAKGIETTSEDLGANTVHVETWEKDIKDLPTYDEYNCCIFPGPYKFQNSFLVEILTDKRSQLLHIQTGDHEGMALTTTIEEQPTDDEFLFVNSVESSSNIFKRESVTKATDRAIQDYAEELGMDGVIYNSEPGNSAPNDFLKNITNYEEKSLNSHTLDNSWVEADLRRQHFSYFKEIN